MAGIFKAYDVRGLYPDQLDETVAYEIGLAFLGLLDPSRGKKVVVSRDMRSHSVPLLESLIRGLTEGGLDVVDIGLATTPLNYWAIGHLDAAGGVQVTASHNPAPYNGFKLSRHGARPVSGDHGIPLLEQAIATKALPRAREAGSRSAADLWAPYAEHILSFLQTPSAVQTDGPRLRVAVDAANGMGTLYRPILEKMEIELIPLYFELDGTFPNHEANPLKEENLADLCQAVRDHHADLGIAFDGDADRAAFVDETGRPVGSDLVTALIAGAMLRREPGQAILFDLRSSRAVPEYIQESGGRPVRERVGHSFMKATLRAQNGIFGGELAGHYYFRDHYYADCSLLAVVEILNLLRGTGLGMSQLVSPLRRYAKSPEINFEVDDKAGMMEALARRYEGGETDRLDGITVTFPTWWFNVRPSNTEPLLRLVVEAPDPKQLEERCQELFRLLGTPV